MTSEYSTYGEFTGEDATIAEYAKQYGFTITSITRTLDGPIKVSAVGVNKDCRIEADTLAELREQFHALVGYPDAPPVDYAMDDEDEYYGDDEDYGQDESEANKAQRALLRVRVADYEESCKDDDADPATCNCPPCAQYRDDVARLAELDALAESPTENAEGDEEASDFEILVSDVLHLGEKHNALVDATQELAQRTREGGMKLAEGGIELAKEVDDLRARVEALEYSRGKRNPFARFF